MKDFTERFAQWTPAQRALMEQRLMSRAKMAKPKIERLEGPKPITHAQESLFFMDKLVPNSPLYVIPQAFRLLGPLNIEALEAAFQFVARRHESLRTRFVTLDNRPMAIV